MSISCPVHSPMNRSTSNRLTSAETISDVQRNFDNNPSLDTFNPWIQSLVVQLGYLDTEEVSIKWARRCCTTNNVAKSINKSEIVNTIHSNWMKLSPAEQAEGAFQIMLCFNNDEKAHSYLSYLYHGLGDQKRLLKEKDALKVDKLTPILGQAIAYLEDNIENNIRLANPTLNLTRELNKLKQEWILLERTDARGLDREQTNRMSYIECCTKIAGSFECFGIGCGEPCRAIAEYYYEVLRMQSRDLGNVPNIILYY